MKMKFVLFIATALFLLADCKSLIDYTHKTNYIYQNDCSLDITVDAHQVRYESYNGYRYTAWSYDSTFTIRKGDAHTLSFWGMGGAKMTDLIDPFMWRNGGGDDSLVVSNGEKQFIQRKYDNDKLYRWENYTLVSQKAREFTFQYTFTDDDFADAEPVVP